MSEICLEMVNGPQAAADDGFYFGLGVFETIHVKNGKPLLMNYHKERLLSGLDVLGIKPPFSEWSEVLCLAKQVMQDFTSKQENAAPDYVLKICATSSNLKITARANTYTEAQYQKGFSLKTSPILRNETSVFTGLKSLNYGDNILEKRRAHNEGFDEPVFFNTRGELAEGATTNLFLLRDGALFTPHLSCGLLPGTMRRYIMSRYPVTECFIKKEDIKNFDEIFVTNALLGIMPVYQFDEISFENHTETWKLINLYRKEIESGAALD